MVQVKEVNEIQVARSQDAVYIRVIGMGRLANALLFEEFCAEMIERGYRYFILDLGECKGMDSTFMGILVGLAQYVSQNGDGLSRTVVCVINASAYCKLLLDTLGLSRIVSIVNDPVKLPKVETCLLPDVSCTDDERLESVKKAHENLVSLDQRNQQRFGQFLSNLTAAIGTRNAAMK